MAQIDRTPETSGAAQVLYFAADRATAKGRAVLFSAIHYLTGLPLYVIERNWQATR